MSRTGFLFKIAVFIFTFALGLLLLVKISDWSGSFRSNLLAAGNWEYLVYLVVFAYCAGYVIKWLVKKEFHEEFVRKRR